MVCVHRLGKQEGRQSGVGEDNGERKAERCRAQAHLLARLQIQYLPRLLQRMVVFASSLVFLVMIKAVGIDLGTTNSAIAIIDDENQALVVKNRFGSYTTPSTVAITHSGTAIVGSHALAQAAHNVNNTIYNSKRFMGQKFNDCTQEARCVGFTVDADKDGDVIFRCSHLPGPLYPEQVAALVLKELLDSLNTVDGATSIDSAVVTVPAYFREAQREATLAAASLAGLGEVTLLSEPVAACLSHGLETVTGKVLVFDLGAGTFDVSILQLHDGGDIEVIATSGDPRLGGIDFDALLIEHISDRAADQGMDPRSSSEAMSQLRQNVENAKIKLSVVKSKTVFVPPTPSSTDGLELELTRSDLERVCEPLLRRLKGPLYEVAISARVAMPGESAPPPTGKPKKRAREASKKLLPDGPLKYLPQGEPLSEIVMVGGASRMTAVRKLLNNLFGVTPRRTVDPMEAVATGAAVYAGIRRGVIKGRVLQKWQADLGRMLEEKS